MIYIRLLHDPLSQSDTDTRWSSSWARYQKGELREQGRGAVPADSEVVLLAPAQDVHYGALPRLTRQVRKLQQAAPFAIEDELASDLESTHVAIAAPGTDDILDLAAVDKNTMQQWRELAKSSQWKLKGIIPEQSVIPVGSSCLFVFENYVVYKGTECVALDSALFPQLIKNAGWNKNTSKIPVFGMPDQAAALVQQLEQMGCDNFELKAQGIWQDLQYEAAASHRVNLLQGIYAKARKAAPWLFRLPGFLSTTAAFIIIMLVAGSWHQQRLSQYADDLWQMQVAEVKQAFPDVQRVVNPKARVQQRLNSLLLASGQDREGGLLTLLGSVGEALQNVSGVELVSFHYQNNLLEVKLLADGVPELDKLRQKINIIGSNKIQADLGTYTSGENGVESHMQVRGL